MCCGYEFARVQLLFVVFGLLLQLRPDVVPRTAGNIASIEYINCCTK